ncbi:Signal recognition particle SEC65 subunit [Lachnellula willkommii]|uniref:Signal recognition particle SEC65 subunit n=1 Tax=Lachnellula willkommii TaxID=215461 RepID=A0A559MMP3_9HELO|nr:Signal recognition particle SEC65 subunit [Lachnellula willkommii]
MSHARIEEVSDSDEDSDPSEGDISDLDSDLDEREVLRQRAPLPVHDHHKINPAHIPSAANSQFQTTEDDSKYKDYQCIYPVYFDARRSRNEGRMVSKALAVENPFARDIASACGQLGLEPLFEAMKFHPKDWSNPGRVKVKLRDGKNPSVKNKHHLYILISKYLKANPTTERAALAIRIPGLPVPDPKKPYQPPDVPKGWKINNILPYYSPAMHGEGVSDNFMKDMMAEMAAGGGGGGGGMPGMPDMSALQGMMGGMGGMGGAGPSGGAAGGGESKKKDKKKKIKG